MSPFRWTPQEGRLPREGVGGLGKPYLSPLIAKEPQWFLTPLSFPQTGRDKDRERVRLLREQARLDSKYLNGVLARHKLEEKWNQWTA